MKEANMSLHISDHWLVYIAEPFNDSPVELIAIPASVQRERLNRAPRVVLAAVDAYHDANPAQSVVFLASVTSWLHERHDLSWRELFVDLDEALADLQRSASAVGIDASPIAAVMVATGGVNLDPSIARHTEPVRGAIAGLLRSQTTTIC